MLTRILLAALYCLGIALACVVIAWVVGMFGVPSLVITLIYAIGAICCLIVFLGAMTGRINLPSGPIL